MAVAGTYTIVDERTGIFVAQALELTDSGEGVETPHISLQNVGFSVNLETRHVNRNDGKHVEVATTKIIQNLIGDPSIRELREAILAKSRVTVGLWFDVPVTVFNKSSYKKIGFASARYKIARVVGPVAEWHLQVSGDDGTVDLVETLAIDTLQATKGRTQGAVERKTQFVFEAKYKVSAL